ncbi:hypothetical protein QE152_g36171 [Popillia japonica]|uniref:Uncharacterized protein n=1 Tax=Popillia japonica TaxID=7064 RepID=A0AAW1IDH9_POPJA
MMNGMPESVKDIVNRQFNGKPGLTAEAFHAIKMKTTEKDIILNIVIDEMSICQQLEWNGETYIGLVDFGTALETQTEATNALVFMAVALNAHWKIPLGYFFIQSCTATERANLLKTCLELLYARNVHCYSITFDGAVINTSMAKHLGAIYDVDNLQPWFPHPITSEKVYTFWDPSHMLKLCRNTRGDWKMVKHHNKLIKWSLLENLQHLHKEEGLHAATKRTARHLNFQSEKMQVRLAAQTLSNTHVIALPMHYSFARRWTVRFLKMLKKLQYFVKI